MPLPEQTVILQALASIRRRLFAVRLAERLAVALAWAAAIALPLTASHLLRNARYLHDSRWLPTVLAVFPMFAAIWLFRRAPRFTATITPILAKIAACLTALLSIAMVIITYLPTGDTLLHAWYIPAAVIASFVVLATATVRMINPRAAAIFIDQKVGLNERVSTALEILGAPPATTPLEAAFNAPVIASALQACQEFRTARVAYHRLDSRAYAAAACALTAAICLSLLPPVAAQARTVRPVSITVVKNAKDLQQVFKELEAKKLPNDKITADRLKPLQNAINQIQQGNMSPIESNAVLNEAKEQMKREQEALAASDKVQEMLRQMSQTQDFAKAADDKKAAELKQAQGQADAGNQQKSAEEGLKNSAQAMADKMKGMSDADKKALADNLQSAADKAKGDPQLQKDLQNAADAARSGDSEKLSQSMQSAGDRMGQQQANQQMSQDSINRAMSEIDRMQGGGPQSTMGGQQGDSGNQQAGGQSGGNGQNSGDGQGQGGGQASQGDGQGNGQQSASAGGGDGKPGNGNGGSQDSGSTNFQQAGGPGGRQTGAPGGLGTFVRIYDQRVNQSSGTQEKVGSFINPMGPANGSTDVMGAADKGDSSIKTYAEVLPEARQRAMDELTRQEYPPQYQDMVRQFYSEPAKTK